MENSERECQWKCKYWGADPDGSYCSHPQALKYSVFGINLNRALGPNGMYPKSAMKGDPAIGICGPNRVLWEKRT